MSGKTLKPGSLAYQLLIWSVVLTVVLGACGDAATATPVPIVPTATAVPIPTATPTIAFTSTPVPTPTPTEIPIVLPTATPPNPNLPATAPAYVEPFTQAPTYTPYPTTTPYPTDRPAPTITPYAAPYVVPLSIYQKALVGPYARLDYIPYPNYTTQCIAANYFTLPATPTPLPTATALPGGVSRAITDVTQIAPPPVPAGNIQLNGRDVSTAPDNEWVTQFETRWITNQRLNQYRLPAPTFTPIPTATPVPTSTPIPTATPLPYNTPDVFTGLTPAPPNTPTDTPAPTNIPATTAPPIVPTWTPSLVDRFQQKGSLTGNFIQSIFISDVTSSLNEYTTDPINFVAMWQVMNDLTLALINVDTPIEVSLRAYEQYLDTTINVILNRSLYDPSLNTTGEQRYAARKIIIGNVPDLRAFRFFAPCFAQDRLKNVQDQYNSIIAKMAAKYPGKVFVADLSNLNWLGNPQWVSVTNGYNLSLGGSNAVADVFGKVFLTLRF